MFREYWNKTYLKYNNNQYDNYLDKYLNNIKEPILDLGSGLGNDTLYLIEKGLNVISIDYSNVSIYKIKKNIKKAKTRVLDITKNLPYYTSSINTIIADLSLHYFNKKETIKILVELKRILKKNGILIARVNSVDDINYGALKGIKKEDNYYYINGYNKRFFDDSDIEKYFKIIGEVKYNKTTMLRYDSPKEVYEIVVKKD